MEAMNAPGCQPTSASPRPRGRAETKNEVRVDPLDPLGWPARTRAAGAGRRQIDGPDLRRSVILEKAAALACATPYP